MSNPLRGSSRNTFYSSQIIQLFKHMLVCTSDEVIKRSWTGLYCDVSGVPAELKLSRAGATKKPKLVTSHVFAETTHVVEAPHGFACVVTPRHGHT